MKNISKPNILFILAEDMCPNMGCYGDKDAITPILDSLANKGIMYTNASSVAPVCSAARTTLSLGMFPPAVGAGNHRSYVKLPEPVKPFSCYMRDAGYYTGIDKTDLNYEFAEDICGWDTILGGNIFADTEELANEAQKAWRVRGDKPFFFMHTFAITHQSRYGHPFTPEAHRELMIPRTKEEDYRDRTKLNIPGYHPDNQATREIWGQYHECITAMDRMVGELLEKLEEDNLLEDTIILFAGDNGMGIPGGKAAMWNEGCHVPFIVYAPPRFQTLLPSYREGKIVDEAIHFYDVAPTILELAGIEVPDHMHGQNIFNIPSTNQDSEISKQSIYGYRDRIDSNYEFIRSIKRDGFLYIRNFYPHRGWRFSAYMEDMAPEFTSEWINELRKNDDFLIYNRKNSYALEEKPSEELYDLENDPNQMNNLAKNIAYYEKVQEYRHELYAFMKKVGDLGFFPERELQKIAETNNVVEISKDLSQYPIDLLFDIADCSITDNLKEEQLIEYLRNPNWLIRYWSVQTLHNVKQYSTQIEKLLLDMVVHEENIMVKLASCEMIIDLATDVKILEYIIEVIKTNLQNKEDVFIPMWLCDMVHHSNKLREFFPDNLWEEVRKNAALITNKENERYTAATTDIATFIQK